MIQKNHPGFVMEDFYLWDVDSKGEINIAPVSTNVNLREFKQKVYL